MIDIGPCLKKQIVSKTLKIIKICFSRLMNYLEAIVIGWRDSNESKSENKVERNAKQSCFFHKVETRPKLTPQKQQFQFSAARPAAVNITSRPCESESKREDEINEQLCSSRSIQTLPKAAPKRKQPQSATVRPTPYNKIKRRCNTSDSANNTCTHLPVMLLQIFKHVGNFFCTC